LFCAGRWEEAEAVMLDALGPTASRSVGHRIEVSARLAELRVDQGRIDEAAQLVAPYAEHVVMCTPRARIHLARGEDELAVAVVTRAVDEYVGDAVRRAPLLGIAVQAELRRGQLDTAERFARDVAALADAGNSPALQGEAQLARGRLAMVKGDTPAAKACFSASARSFERAERPLQAAVAMLELAEAHDADGNRTNAVVDARAAHAVFTRVGAKPLADRAASILRRLGDSVRARPVDVGAAVGSLTRRESEVLDLIRQGLTNPEIGERLFISTKTAEHHVGRVLAKLGVKSRAEAAAVATASRSQLGGRGNGGPT
jgi:DNA-binding NarL/FixJ family response regulator